MKAILLGVLLAACWLTACQSAPINDKPPPTTFPSVTATLLASPSPRPSESNTPPPATVTPSPLPDQPPTSTAIPACVIIYYQDYAQVEVIAPQGGHVLVDVSDPARLSAPVSANDILLTTHTHWDHVNDDFLASFPGQQLFVQEGSISLLWVKIQGLASAHNQGDTFKPEGGTNYIYLIEVAGLRLAHFGDIGQEAFTEEQLAALLPLDIAITQIANAYSDMSAANQKGIRLIAQLAPRLVIPTHADLDSAKLAVGQWPGLYSEKASVRLCKDQLPDETKILFLGEWAVKFPKYLDLQAIDW